MSESYEIIATPVFKLTLRKLCSFLSSKYGSDTASQVRETIKQRVISLAENPRSAPVSDRLEALGLTDYRQLLVDSHNLIYYRVDEGTKKVILVVAMDSRQSLEQLLFEVTITLP